MPTPTEQKILIDLQEWLRTPPERAAILDYVSRIPEKYTYLLDQAATLVEEEVWIEKKAYFIDNQAESFLQYLSEFDQLEYLGYWTEYQPASVLNRLNKRFPELKLITVPSEITQWSKRYYARFDACLLFATAPLYLERRLYVQSLLKQNWTVESLHTTRQELEAIFLQDGKLFDSLTPLNRDQVKQYRQSLSRLEFLPDTYLEQLLNPTDDQARYEFLQKVIPILVLMEEFTLEKARQNEEVFYNAFWDQLTIARERSLLVRLEAKRYAEYGPVEPLKKLYFWLESLWEVPNLRSGLLQQKTLAYMQGLPPAQRILFWNYFTVFLEKSILMEIIFEPIDPSLLVWQLERTSNYQALTDLVAGIHQQIVDSDRKQLAEVLIKFIFSLKQMVEPSLATSDVAVTSPTNSYSHV